MNDQKGGLNDMEGGGGIWLWEFVKGMVEINILKVPALTLAASQ